MSRRDKGRRAGGGLSREGFSRHKCWTTYWPYRPVVMIPHRPIIMSDYQSYRPVIIITKTPDLRNRLQPTFPENGQLSMSLYIYIHIYIYIYRNIYWKNKTPKRYNHELATCSRRRERRVRTRAPNAH